MVINPIFSIQNSPTKTQPLRTMLTTQVTHQYLSTSLLRQGLSADSTTRIKLAISNFYDDFGLVYSGTLIERSVVGSRQHYIVTLLLGDKKAVKGKHKLTLSASRDVREYIYPRQILRSELDSVRLLKRLGANCELSSDWLAYLK